MTTQMLRPPRNGLGCPIVQESKKAYKSRSCRRLLKRSRPLLTPSALLFACENVLYDATVWDRWLVRLLRHVGVAIDQATFSGEWETEFCAKSTAAAGNSTRRFAIIFGSSACRGA